MELESETETEQHPCAQSVVSCRLVSGRGDKMLQCSRFFSYWLSVRNFYINLLLVTTRAKAKGCSRRSRQGDCEGWWAVECGLCQGNRLWLLNYELNWRQQLLEPATPGYCLRCAFLSLSLPYLSLALFLPQSIAKALKLFFTFFSTFIHVFFLPVLRLSDSVLMAF